MPLSWPSTGLPTQWLEEGYSEQWADNVLQSKADLGPPLTRRRGTAAPWFFQAAMLMTGTQVANISTFYVTTTAYGSLSFTMTQPRLNTTVTAQFTGPPGVIAAGPDKYRVPMSFMVHP